MHITSYLRIWCAHAGTNVVTHTQTTDMLSPNVINTVKRLTSWYLFKSQHQTNSFFFFIWLIREVTVRGERRLPISSPSCVQRDRPNKARAFSSTPSLSFIIYRGSVPHQRRPRPEQGRSLSGGQWTVELEVAAESLWQMMSGTSDADAARHQAEGDGVKREGGQQNGKQWHGAVGSRGCRMWMERVFFVWVFLVLLKEIHSLNKENSHACSPRPEEL